MIAAKLAKKINQITWVNFLHGHQPPWQNPLVIRQVARQSYEYLLALVKKYPSFTFSLSISGSLVELLAKQEPQILGNLRLLVKNKRLELVGTAKFHPILPLTPTQEIIRQVRLNEQVLKKYFNLAKPKGFYLPEMAYSFSVARVIKKLGYHWLILDPIHCTNNIESGFKHQIKGVGLSVVFRNSNISRAYPPRKIYEQLAKNKPGTIITATDAEMYGHWHEDWQGYIEKILSNTSLKILTVGQYLESLKYKKFINLRPASWQSKKNELENKISYSLWSDPKNKIHRLLWQLADLATISISRRKKDKNWIWARKHLDQGLSSCAWWWASVRKPSPFSPLTWNPDMIEAGAKELIKSIRSLDKLNIKKRLKAENLYLDLKKEIWHKHWKIYHRH